MILSFAPEDGALKVGPILHGSWWSNSIDDVTTVLVNDDEYMFNADGSFSNVLESETWLEGWQDGIEKQGGAPSSP